MGAVASYYEINSMNRDLQIEDDAMKIPTTTAFGMLPNQIARDKRVSPELLVLIGYRLTFAGDYGLSERICSRRDGRGTPIARHGFSRDVFRRAVELGETLRLYKRWQSRGEPGKFRYARDRLILPPCGASGLAGRRVYRAWFRGDLDVNELAALLLLRAGTGKGVGTFCRELRERFDWSKPTALKVIRTLTKRGLIETRRTRDQRGCFRSTRYVNGLLQHAAMAKSTGDGFHRGRGKPATHAEESPLHGSPPSFTAGESP